MSVFQSCRHSFFIVELLLYARSPPQELKMRIQQKKIKVNEGRKKIKKLQTLLTDFSDWWVPSLIMISTLNRSGSARSNRTRIVRPFVTRDDFWSEKTSKNQRLGKSKKKKHTNESSHRAMRDGRRKAYHHMWVLILFIGIGHFDLFTWNDREIFESEGMFRIGDRSDEV